MSRVVAFALMWCLFTAGAVTAISETREAAEKVVHVVSEFMADFPNGDVSELEKLRDLPLPSTLP